MSEEWLLIIVIIAVLILAGLAEAYLAKAGKEIKDEFDNQRPF